MASKYVSAQWLRPAFPGDKAMIKAIGDDGIEYFVPDYMTDVPPWPQFLADGGVVKEADPPPEVVAPE